MIRRLVAIVSIATLVAWSALPPVHVHVGQRSDSRDPAEGIIHAHWAAHEDVDFQITLRDGHGRRLILDQQGTVSSLYDNTRAPAIGVVALPIAAPLLTRQVRRRGTDASTRDGPPRGLALLRAPPVVA